MDVFKVCSDHDWFLCEECGPVTKLSENDECFFLKERENLSCYYPPPPSPSKKMGLSIKDYLHILGPLNFCVKSLSNFIVQRFFRGNFQTLTNKDLALVTVPFSSGFL